MGPDIRSLWRNYDTSVSFFDQRLITECVKIFAICHRQTFHLLQHLSSELLSHTYGKSNCQPRRTSCSLLDQVELQKDMVALQNDIRDALALSGRLKTYFATLPNVVDHANGDEINSTKIQSFRPRTCIVRSRCTEILHEYWEDVRLPNAHSRGTVTQKSMSLTLDRDGPECMNSENPTYLGTDLLHINCVDMQILRDLSYDLPCTNIDQDLPIRDANTENYYHSGKFYHSDSIHNNSGGSTCNKRSAQSFKILPHRVAVDPQVALAANIGVFDRTHPSAKK